MTAPSGVTPSGSVNEGSLAEFAAKSEAEWRAEITADTEAPWGSDGLLGNLWQDLDRGEPLVVSIIGSIADALGLGRIWDGVQSALDAIRNWVFDIPIIGDIVEAITGVVGGTMATLRQFFAGFVQGAGSLLQQIVGAITGIFQGDLSILTNFFADAGDFIKKIAQAITGVAGNGLSTIVEFFSGIVQGAGSLLTQIVNAITGGFDFTSGPLKLLKDFFADAGDLFSRIFGKIAEAIMGVFSGNPLEALGDFFSDAGEFVSNIFGRIVEAITGVFGGLPSLTDFFADAGDFIKKIVQAITGAAGNGLSTLVEFFSGFAQGAGSLISQIVKAITGVVGGGLANLTNFFADAGDFIKKIAQAITGIAGNGLQTIIDFFAGFAQGAGSLIQQIVKAITGAVGGGLANLTDFFADAGDFLKRLAQAITGAAGNGLATIAAWASDVFGRLGDLIDGIWQKFTGEGSFGHSVAEAIGSIGDWLSNAWQRLVDGIADVFNPTGATNRPVIDAINSILGILGIGTNAQITGDNASMGVEQIKAELAGGTFDEFDYDAASWLPTPPYVRYVQSSQGSGTFGPDGKGRLAWRNLGTGSLGRVFYRRSDVTMTDAATIKVVLSKPPTGIGAAYVFANFGEGQPSRAVQINASNLNVVTLGADMVSPTPGPTGYYASYTPNSGDVIECRFMPDSVQVDVNGILKIRCALTDAAFTGKAFGIGAYMPTSGFLGKHDGPEFAGWTWLLSATPKTRSLRVENPDDHL